MSAAIHMEKVCRNCTKQDTPRCDARKEGQRPGPGDWCSGYRAKIERKVA